MSNKEKKILSSHGPNDTHITLYLPLSYRKHIERTSIQCEDPRLFEEIDKHGMDENFLDTNIGKFLESKVKPFIIEQGWQYMNYSNGAFYAFNCIGAYKCCMRHIKKKPFWKDMPDIKITKIVICDKVGRESNHSTYGGRDFVLVGNTCEYRHVQLTPSHNVPDEFCHEKFKGVGAPAEFNIEYDEDGKAIFNKTNYKNLFFEILAEQMRKVIDEQVEERVGLIESATTVVPTSSVEIIETLPVATEVTKINDNSD